MIGTLFEFGGEVIEVRLNGTNILFRKTETNGLFAPLEALQLSKQGAIKEWPDLADNHSWKEIAIQRFKAKIAELNNEDKAMEFVINDLRKFGYKPLIKQRAGFRPEKIK